LHFTEAQPEIVQGECRTEIFLAGTAELPGNHTPAIGRECRRPAFKILK